jgi:hypothetical protein
MPIRFTSSLIVAQVAGIRAGGSADAYAAAFADIAARRKDLEYRRGALVAILKVQSGNRPKPASDWRRRALNEAKLVLESDRTGKEEKRGLFEPS